MGLLYGSFVLFSLSGFSASKGTAVFVDEDPNKIVDLQVLHVGEIESHRSADLEVKMIDRGMTDIHESGMIVDEVIIDAVLQFVNI